MEVVVESGDNLTLGGWRALHRETVVGPTNMDIGAHKIKKKKGFFVVVGG